MIVAFASPPAARAQQPRAQTRVEAQWLERRGGARQITRWRMAHRRMAAVAWRRGYVRGFAVGRHPLRAAAWRRGYVRGLSRARLYGRFWERQRLGRMGARWSL